MTALRTYAAELAAVSAVLRPRRVEAREWARPDAWELLEFHLDDRHGYYVAGRYAHSRASDDAIDTTVTFVGGVTDSSCWSCGPSVRWWDSPCAHQLGLAALWVGGHPIKKSPDFGQRLHRELEGGAK